MASTSRGRTLVMLALNKKTKQAFCKKGLNNKFKWSESNDADDPEYLPSSSASEDEDLPDKNREHQEEHSLMDFNTQIVPNLTALDENNVVKSNNLSAIEFSSNKSVDIIPAAKSLDISCVNNVECNTKIKVLQVITLQPMAPTLEISSKNASYVGQTGNFGNQFDIIVSDVLSNTEAEHADSIQAIIPEYKENEIVDNLPKTGSPSASVSGRANDIQVTKKGTVRKRRKYETSVEERKKKKYDSYVEKHDVKNGCGEQCPRKCMQKISQLRREFLNREFWKMAEEKERKSFILHHVSSTPVKQRTTTPAAGENYQRNKSYSYTLKNENGTSCSVCKNFFLTTLGFSRNNDKVVRTALLNAKNSVAPKPDMRCTKRPHNKIDDDIIRQHISSFGPTISHYRREHAPRRLYLPSDLTFTAMYEDFRVKNPNFECSCEKYRVVAKKMNVSLAKLGHEECENCEVFNLHDKSHTKDNLDENCQVCMTWNKHNNRATKSRTKYREDAEKDEVVGEIVYCADLEKVIMLPRLEMFKNAIFTNRLTVYNESFVPVGKRRNSKPFAALWHEALFKRNKEELISTFYQFFVSKRDVSKITLWLDNCTAQNKNWAFFSFLLYIVNSDEVSANEIIVKYFEPGHTFMAADSFHHRVEMSMKKMGNKLYDFADFAQAVKNAAPKTEVFLMELQHFYIWDDFSSQYKLTRIQPRPYLHEMVQVTVHRGSYNIIYKNDFDGPSFDLNILSAKITKTKILPPPKKQTEYLGISKQKKDNIIKNLSGILKNRLNFWENLPVSDEK